MLTLGSIVLFLVQGLNYGIDFGGGTHHRGAHASGPADLARDALARSTASASATCRCRVSARRNEVLIRLQRQPGGDKAQEAAVEKVKAHARQHRSNTAAPRWWGRRSAAS